MVNEDPNRLAFDARRRVLAAAALTFVHEADDDLVSFASIEDRLEFPVSCFADVAAPEGRELERVSICRWPSASVLTGVMFPVYVP